jgi:tRNA (cytidine/uridine-2'-O-)-methyltransferase
MLTLKNDYSREMPNGIGYGTASGCPAAVGGPDSASPRLCKWSNCPTCATSGVPLIRLAMRLCLYQPEIAGNVGAVMRLGACMGVPVDLIEPMGFEWDDKRVRRTAMDYIDHVDVNRHPSFDAYRAAAPGRLILFTTKGDRSAYDFHFEANDILMFGRESGGVPADVAAASDARLRIPIRPEVRSFNLAMSAALALGEALRQVQGLPE